MEKITKQGCIDYISSYVESMRGEIKGDGSIKDRFLEEKILFFSKAVELLKNNCYEIMDKDVKGNNTVRETDKESDWFNKLLDESCKASQSEED